MGFFLEYGILNPETEQYAGTGSAKVSLASVAADAKRIESLGVEGVSSPQARPGALRPRMVAAQHNPKVARARSRVAHS